MSKPKIDLTHIVDIYQQVNNIDANTDSLFFNINIKIKEQDTIICIEGGNIEHYSYIGPMLAPPPLPELLNGDSLQFDSKCNSIFKELMYFGTLVYDNKIISIFYEKDFSQSFIEHLFDGYLVENREPYIKIYNPDASLTLDYISLIFKLSCTESSIIITYF